MTAYVHQPYPACRYHPTEKAIVVANEAEDAALGPGWVDSPAKLTTPSKPPAPVDAAAATPVSSEPLFGSPPEIEKPAPRPRKSK